MLLIVVVPESIAVKITSAVPEPTLTNSILVPTLKATAAFVGTATEIAVDAGVISVVFPLSDSARV